MARGTRSRSAKDAADATTVITDRGAVVEQAAAATVVNDTPDTVLTATDAVSVVQPDAADGDPLTSFLDDAEAKLGRDTRVTPPGDSEEADAAAGKPSVADAPEEDFDFTDDGDLDLDSGDDPADDSDDDAGGDDAGSDDSGLDSGDNPDEFVEDPGADGEGAPIPAELQVQLDSEVGRFRAGRPDAVDTVADPSEIESEAVGPASALTSQAERGQTFFGQPRFEAPSGSDTNFNPGADSSGAGAVDPGEDQIVPTGATRDDDPFADAGPSAEPVTSSSDATADAQSFLPSETTGIAIDDTSDVPDAISDPV